MQPIRFSPAADVRRSAAEVHHVVATADWRSTLARWGLAAKGMLYLALGVLVSRVARGDASSDAATRTGAIELVASQPFGQWLLGILTFGLFALAAWQFILAAKGDPVEGGEKKDRLRYAGKAVLYLGTALTALSILLPRVRGGAVAGGGSGDASPQQATATVLSWPGGEWIVMGIGAAVVGFAMHQLHRHAWKKAFMQRLDRLSLNAGFEKGVERAGRTGYAARALVLAIAGEFLIVAALQHDPQQAVGLSGALQAIAEQAWGKAVLWFVAAGLFLYGCFCFAEARYRRAT